MPRAKLRPLMAVRAARLATERSSSRWSGIHASSSRSGARAAGGDASCTLNCAWPPGRWTNSTSRRATARAASAPWSSSTSLSDRSMPAVTPADVHTDPSCTKIGSRSTRTPGKAAARRSHCDQCVVARFPSSSPARASTKAPEHTDVTRRVARRGGRDPADEGGVVHGGGRAVAPHDHQGVDGTPTLRQAAVDAHHQAARRARRDPWRAHHLDGVAVAAPAAAAGRREDLHRPGEVEDLEPVEDHDHHTPGIRSCGIAPDGSNAKYMTISATPAWLARPCSLWPGVGRMLRLRLRPPELRGPRWPLVHRAARAWPGAGADRTSREGTRHRVKAERRR